MAEDKMAQREFELKQLELTFRNTEEYRNIETHRPIVDHDLSIRNNMCRFHFQLNNQHSRCGIGQAWSRNHLRQRYHQKFAWNKRNTNQ